MIESVDERRRARTSRRRVQVRRRRAALAAAAVVALIAGLAVGAGGGDDERERAPDASPQPRAQPPPEQAVERLTLEQQVGRLVILRFAGTEAPEYVRRVLGEGRAAGAILFRDNVTDPVQLRALTRSLRRAGRGVLVCVDQEGGPIRTVPWAAPERAAPAQLAFGAVREDSRAGGRDLRAAGINVTLGPVADIPSVDGSVMTNRAFTADPTAAIAAVAESVAGWHDGGVATTVKHFPGLGGATVNTDEAPATVDRTRDELEEDLGPYVFAIQQGTEFIMASHAVYPALDGERIASQSPEVIGGLLREQLGYDGVVMTDSIEAEAVLAVSDVEQAAVASVEAGVDVILTTGRGSYIRVYRALLARARANRAFRERVRESATRVLAAQSSANG
jgi:beta-N-acetylhexosaminidase